MNKAILTLTKARSQANEQPFNVGEGAITALLEQNKCFFFIGATRSTSRRSKRRLDRRFDSPNSCSAVCSISDAIFPTRERASSALVKYGLQRR